MADVKWIKIVTNIFEDEKMLLIDSLPGHDSIIVIWFKLLCLAGKQNNSGVFVMNDNIPFTDKMLATVFRRPLNMVKSALEIFQKYGMIEIYNDTISIPNWEKHQNLDSYEKKKERDRLYQTERRTKQQLIAKKSSDNRLTADDLSSDVAVSEEDIDKDIDIEKEKDKEKETNHKYGEYKNVLLSDSDVEKLKNEFPSDWEKRIEALSEGIAVKGYKYKNHLAVIRKWARMDKERAGVSKDGITYKNGKAYGANGIEIKTGSEVMHDLDGIL